MKAYLKPIIQKFERSSFYSARIEPFRKVYKAYSPGNAILALFHLIESEIRLFLFQSKFDVINENEVKRRKKSDTVFIFGSGASLHEISDTEWTQIGLHDTIGLNYFVHQDWIDVDIHYVREIEMPLRQFRKFRRQSMLEACREFCGLVERNSHYKDTLFFLQTDFYAEVGKSIIGWKLLPENQPVCFYQGLRNSSPVSSLPRKLKDGLPRQAGAIGGGLAIAHIFGWKNIVLVGVDMYNSRYFWLPPEESRNYTLNSNAEPHPTTKRGIFNIIRNWKSKLQADGITLTVYNPKSLLIQELDAFAWDNDTPIHAKAQTDNK